MSTIACFTLGYQTFTGDERFIKALISASSRGAITAVEKKYINGEYVAKVGKLVDVSVEHLEVQTEREIELAELRERLKKLEAAGG